MANYSLVINSKFRPFEYQELLAPVLMATQAHQAVEEAYADLSTKASIWDKMANEATDPKAHAIYKKYADDLQAQSEELSMYGLTPASRQSMLNMRSRYARDITPIETAYKRREEQMKQQNAILAQDPTRMFARRAAETSLDAFLERPTLDTIAQNYSGSLLTKQVSNAAAALAKDARNDPKVQTELRKLLPYQYETIRRTGFDPETVRQAILNSPNADKILTGIVDNVIANSGIGDWNYVSPKDKQRILAEAREHANEGLWSAVGQTQYGNITDTFGMQSALESIRRSNAMKEKEDKPETPTGTGIRHWSMGTEGAKYLGVANDLYKKMMNGKGNMVMGYSGKNYTNPLKIYKEYLDLGKKSTKTTTRCNPRTGRCFEARTSSDYEGAAEAIKKKYGVTKILTEQEYNALKSLGYDENSRLSDFNNNGFEQRINRAGSSYAATSTNMADYGHAQSVIFPAMQRYYRDSNPGFLYEYTSKGRGKAVSFNDVVKFDDKNKPNVSIDDISYSIKSPNDLILTVGGKDYYISPEGYGRDLQKIVQGYKDRYWNLLETPEDKSQYQDMVTEAIRNELDRFNKVRGNTDSKR